jgi:hypothetical protein
MTHIRLDRTDKQRFGTILAEHLGDGVRLLRIADFGACAVRFDIYHLVRIDASFAIDLVEQIRLTFAGWKCDA